MSVYDYDPDTGLLREWPRRCACGHYLALSQRDLDDHIMAMMHLDDGGNHA